MPSVQVTIGGRDYKMACGEGEEAHLESLAAAFDQQIGALRASFGEIGDMRLHVMAALTTADELSETRRRVAALEGEIAAIKAVVAADGDRTETSERHFAAALRQVAERVERVARSFGPLPSGAAKPPGA